jgi:tagatose 1,6-diphosphate aldolase
MTHKETGEELGVINLRCSSVPHIEQYAGHVGFAVHEPHRGHRYAARSIALLIAFSKQLKFESVYITCDPENVASRRSIELAGGEYLGIMDVPANCIIHKTGHPLKCRYRIEV